MSEPKQLKKGSADLIVLAMLEERSRHGYEIARQIERQSQGALTFQAASLYPILYRLETRRLIQGRWVEAPGQRRRRFYRLTPAGRKVLASQRSSWREFFLALNRLARIHPV
jgi:transcriptional regulator